MDPRKTTLGVVLNGVDVSKDLSKTVESLTYSDSMDESDSLSIRLDDRDKYWISNWFPMNGDRISATILPENWNYEGEKRTIFCGEFVVDDFAISGPLHKCQINGVSAPVMSDFKETKGTKTWEKVTIQQVSAEIATKYGLALVYDTSTDITIDRQEQNGETDSSFLKKICNRYGLGMKIYASKLIIWNYKEYDQKETAAVITPANCNGKWSYKSSVQGTYTGARVTYTDASKKKGLEITVGVEGRILTVNEKAESEADAIRIGENSIWNANRKECTISIEIRPDCTIFTSQNVDISGFGKVDGKYRVEKVTHNVSKTGYTEQLSLSRIV